MEEEISKNRTLPPGMGWGVAGFHPYASHPRHARPTLHPRIGV